MKDNSLEIVTNLCQEPLLPRSAWNSKVTYLKAVFKAKKALDIAENEAGFVRD
uniref:Uncharacterized protein n=1 Tax=Nostoc sp. (strain PCC 8009) TaxID=29413 RepID=A0A2P0ZGR7_NOSS8|nr:hypothetical protein [Nostoc sp. PCC 8009]